MATSVLNATVGGAWSNTYATLGEAEQYHEDRVASGTAWTATSTEEGAKTKALLMATLLLDRAFEWSGHAVDRNQALQWPRTGMLKPTGFEHVASTEIPVQIKNAQAEYARQLLADLGRTDDSDIETKGITRIKAGPVELEFKDSVFAKAVPDLVVLLIPEHWYYAVRGRASGTRQLVRA